MSTAFPFGLASRTPFFQQLAGIGSKAQRSAEVLPGRIPKNQAFYFFLEYPGPKRSIVNILHVKKTRGPFTHALYVLHYHAMRKSDFKKYFAATPFKHVRYFGSYRFHRYSVKRSKRLIVVAEK